MNDSDLQGAIDRLFPGALLRSIDRLTGGVSADVYRLQIQTSDGSVQRLVLRVHGSTHSGHGAELEFRLLAALHQAGLPVPRPIQVDTSGAHLTHPFLVLEFIDGTSEIPVDSAEHCIDTMADLLARIHATPTEGLPSLPDRVDPLPEVFDYLPGGGEWEELRAHLLTLDETGYRGRHCLLHGDFWPENLLWANDEIRAVLDWEDAALGDPLSDVAVARVELRYRYGRDAMQRFTAAYARHHRVDGARLALWQVYVAAAAAHFMGGWGLPEARVAHMRREALASIREAGAALMGRAQAPRW